MLEAKPFKNAWKYILGGIIGLILINSLDWSWILGVAGGNAFKTIYMGPDNLGRYVNLYFKGSATVLVLALTSAIYIYASSLGKKLKPLKMPAQYILAIMVLIYIAVFSLMSYLKFSAFHAYHDMAANLEALFNVYRTGLPLSTAEGSLYELPVMNWFGIHFTPIIYLFAIIAFPFRFPGGVFILQSFLLASGAIPVFLVAHETLKNKAVALLFAAVYLLFPTIQYTNLYAFEFYRFATPLLLWAFFFLQRQKFSLAYLFVLLILMTREDVAPVVFIFGIYIVFALKQKRLGGLVTITALVYAFLTQLFFRPFFCGQGTDFVIKNVFGEFGKTPFQVVFYLLSHPFTALSLMFSPLKIANVLLLLLPLGLLSLASPWHFVIALFGMLIPLLAPGIGQASIFLHKYAAAIPFLFIAAIFGFKNISIFLSKNIKKPEISIFVYLLVCGLLCGVYFGPSPISRQFWDSGYTLADFRTHNFHYSHYRITPHAGVAREALDMVPKGAVVSAEHFFLPHLFDRKKLYTFPIIGRDVEYVLIDRKHPNKKPEFNPGSRSSEIAMLFRRDPASIYQDLERNWKFRKIFDSDGVELYQRKEKIR